MCQKRDGRVSDVCEQGNARVEAFLDEYHTRCESDDLPAAIRLISPNPGGHVKLKGAAAVPSAPRRFAKHDHTPCP